MSEDGAGMRIAVLGMGRRARAISVRLSHDGPRVSVRNRSEGRADEVVFAAAPGL
jgi:shikimate 5-dehydrogenase